MKILFFASVAALAATTAFAGGNTPAISGNYLEVRSCDVYTGSCFANSEMGLTGKEATLVWSVQEGAWNGVELNGLNVMAVIKADGTLGNLKYNPRSSDAVLIVDSKASPIQKAALADFARAMSKGLISKVVEVQSVPVTVKFGGCKDAGCSSVKAGNLVEIATSCLGGKHDVCGNEETFYPPLSPVNQAYPVLTDLATFTGAGLDVTWQIAGKRSAFLGSFSTPSKVATQVALR